MTTPKQASIILQSVSLCVIALGIYLLYQWGQQASNLSTASGCAMNTFTPIGVVTVIALSCSLIAVGIYMLKTYHQEYRRLPR